MSNITIAIVEDEVDFQDWIRDEIAEAEDISLLGAFDVAEDALRHIPALNPHIVIMDLTLQKSPRDGIECMVRLLQVLPEVQYLVITANNDEEKLFEAIKVGARAYLQKDEIPRELVDLIREFHAGGSPMSPGIARRVLNYFNQPTELISKLSARELEVLRQMARGFLYKEIAANLDIEIGTVKQHTHKIYKKLDVNNNVEAILKYLGRKTG